MIDTRITAEYIESVILSEHYFTAEQGAAMETADTTGEAGHPQPPSLRLLTFCVLVLKNSATVTGESYCASQENFDSEDGRKYARENAISNLWTLEGYLLKDKLSRISSTKNQ